MTFPQAAKAKSIVAAAAALSLATTLLLLLPTIAAAAPKEADDSSSNTTGAQLGKNVAELITGFTKPLLVAVAGMMAFAAFGKRDTGRVLTITMVTTVIGGFVYNPGGVMQKVITTMWSQVS